MADQSVPRLPAPNRFDSIARTGRGVWRFITELFSELPSAAGTLIVLFFFGLALFGPIIAPYGENDQNHDVSLEPSRDYPFGTDYLGRDVYSRVILGARSIFFTAGIGTLIAVATGTVAGLVIGFQGGWLDEVGSRLIDATLALPALLLALVILGVLRNLGSDPADWVASLFGDAPWVITLLENVPALAAFAGLLIDQAVLLVIAVVYVPIVARVVRGSTLAIKTREFIQAARIRGESQVYIIFREILPSVVPTLVVEASLRFSYAIFLVASLGFLGVGARPPSPDWGLMVSQHSGAIYDLAPWALNYPAAAIALLVVGVNLMSDGIKRVIQKGE